MVESLNNIGKGGHTSVGKHLYGYHQCSCRDTYDPKAVVFCSCDASHVGAVRGAVRHNRHDVAVVVNVHGEGEHRGLVDNAELALGLMISLTRFVGQCDRGMRAGRWQRPAGRRIEESVIALAGFGRIGSMIAGLLAPFRPRQILAVDLKDKSAQIAALRERGVNIRAATLDEALENADLLSVHLPHSPRTRGLFDATKFARMKPGAFFVNTARGELVVEAALAEALRDGRLAGAALDAFHEEPYRGPLLGLDNVLLTPHLGSCGIDSRARMESEAAAEALRFLRGEPLQQEAPDEEYLYQKE